MNKRKIIWFCGFGMLLLGMLVVLFTWSDQISHDNQGIAYQSEKIIRSILVVLIAWITTRLVTLIFLDPISQKREKPLPNIIKDVIGIVIYCIALAVIITEVYNESITSIGAFIISSWAIIGFASKEFIAECIHGISLDLQADFEIGDWVEFKDGKTAKIIVMKMTGVDLLLPNNTVLFINNSTLNNEPMINLCKPRKDYFIGLNVILEHAVPVDRARRILQAATISSPGVFNNEAKVFAESVASNGIVYVVYFKIPDRSVWLESRHQVINSITKYLHKFDLKVCQITGEINIRALENKSNVCFDDYYAIDALTALKMSKLLENCEENIKEEFAKRMKMHRYNIGEIIVKEGEDGDTMFIIAEGIVDVQIAIGLHRNNSENRKEDVELNRVACLVDGEYFGEMALLKGEKRNANIIARTDVVIYEIQRETIKWFVQQYSDFAEKLSLSVLRRNATNSDVRARVIEEKDNEKKAVSEFINAFKKFLWDH